VVVFNGQVIDLLGRVGLLLAVRSAHELDRSARLVDWDQLELFDRDDYLEEYARELPRYDSVGRLWLNEDFSV